VTSSQQDGGAWLDRALGAAAAILLFGMMLLTAADVVSRYMFNWPLRGAFEVTELGLLTLIFAGLPLVSRADQHVTMDFIDKLLGERGQRLVRRLADMFCGAVILALAWQTWLKAGKIGAYGDTTDVLKIPVAPFVYFMAIMVAVTGIVHVLKAVWPGEMAAAEFDPDRAGTT
jgi:TRAP-type transport system small permease protein